MNQGRRIGKMGIVLLILINTVMLNAVIQTELKNEKWQLIGFMGPAGASSAVNYRQDRSREVIDIADANTTYLVKENSNANGQLAYKTGNGITDLAVTYTGTTTQIGSSIGIFAIKNQRSPSGETTLASTEATAVKMKISNPKEFIVNLPKYRMYIGGRSDVAAVRIDYQADYEGQQFKIKFGNETKDYVGYFNYSSTFLTPYILVNSADLPGGSNVNSSASIQDSIDFNINDNNITEMLVNDDYTVKNTAGLYNQDLTDYSSSTDYQATVYRFEDQKWEHFDSRNSKASSNDFTKLHTGRGYWIKITNERTTRDEAENAFMPIRTGLITSSTTVMNPTNHYKDIIKAGWNLLSFRDTNIRYAPSGVFIPRSVWTSNLFGGVQLFFKSEGEFNGSWSGRIELGTSVDNNYSDTNAAARAINLAMQVNSDISSEFAKVRAIPAMDFNSTYGTAIPGIIILSDGLFELSTSGNTTIDANASHTIKTIAKGNLKQLANGNYGSVYGEYMNFININTALDANPEVNSSLSVSIHNGKSSPVKTNSLNDGNNTNRLKNILEAFEEAATKNGETTPYTRTSGYLTTLNFNDTTDYTDENNMTHVLISSGERYSISDSTFTKVYKYKDSGKFVILSSSGSRNVEAIAANTGTTAADNLINMRAVITAINTQTANTGITAIELGTATGTTDAYFAIMSTSKGLDLLENDTSNLFEDIQLTNGAIPDIAKTRGPITSVHSTNNIFNTDIVINRDVLDGNATYYAMFDVNFSSNFEDNKTFETNGSAAITAAMTLAATGNWPTKNVYIKDATEINLSTGNYVIGGDLIIEDSTVRIGKSGVPVTLRVGGKIITIGDVTLDINKSAGRITTGFFNKRDSNATTITQLNPSSGTLTFSDVNLSAIDINGTVLDKNNTVVIKSANLDSQLYQM